MLFQFFITQSRILCLFKTGNLVSAVNAQLLGDKIYCDNWKPSNPNSVTSTEFNVIWGGFKPLDNPENIFGKIIFSR